MSHDSTPELSETDFARSIPRRRRERLLRGRFESGDDVVTLRRFIGLTQPVFARALGVSVATLRNWEHDRRKPDVPALVLLRIAARHPGILREAASTRA